MPEDRYQLGEQIGHDGMAAIYRGYDTQMKRPVTIKVLRDEYSADPRFITIFQRGAEAQQAVHHPNVVQVYEYVQSNGKYFMVMESVEGTNLRSYQRSQRVLDVDQTTIITHGVFDVDRAIIIAHSVALGLGAAHQRGIVTGTSRLRISW